MKIRNDYTQPNFRAIKLSKCNYDFAKYVASSLKLRNIDVMWKKEILTGNDFRAKQNVFNDVRESSNYISNECEFVFLPNSNECWVLGDRIYEQKLYKTISSIDSESVINLLL